METLFYAFENSDTVGKAIVVVLIGFSVVVWSIFITKSIYVHSVKKSTSSFERFRQKCARCPLSIAGEMERTNTEGPLFEICRTGLATLKDILNLQSGLQGYELERAGVLPRTLTDREIDQIYAAINRAVNQQQELLEGNLAKLGTLGSIAPMLGLLGTVWGVMATFVGIVAAGGRPDIQHIAPGISGALLTTVGGLLVAIPVIAMSNYCNSALNTICIEMDNFTQEFLTAVSTARIATPESAPAPATAPAPASAPAPVTPPLASPFAHGQR